MSIFGSLFGPRVCTHDHAYPFRRHGAEKDRGYHLYGWYCPDCKTRVER